MFVRFPAGRPRRWWYRTPLLAAVILLGLSALACGGDETRASDDPAAATRSPTTQVNEGGQVTVKVTWLGAEGGPAFTVTLDTHSVDLDRIDLQDLALLRTDDGREYRPLGWDAPKGGHHREGTLRFAEAGGDGAPLVRADTRSLTLTIRDVAGAPERSFQWLL